MSGTQPGMGSGPARIVVADAHPIFRVGLVQTLNGRPDLQLVGEAADGREALELCCRLVPDLVLMDVKMPGMDGLAVTRAIKEAFPRTVVLFLTACEDASYFSGALRAGATGYLLKDASEQEVIDAIQSALRGEHPLNKRLATRLLLHLMNKVSQEEYATLMGAGLPEQPPEQALVESLTPRETDILRLMARGHKNQEIATSLLVGVGTIKKHAQSLFRKLGVSDRTQAALRATELGLLPPQEGKSDSSHRTV